MCMQSWHFFRRRIAIEEEHLCFFFGDAYEDYAREVPTRIPFMDNIVNQRYIPDDST